MAIATYYAKQLYRNHIYMGCIRDPEQVMTDFNNDINRFVPVHFSCNGSNRIFATFVHDNELIFYELPIDWNNRNGGNNNV